MFFRGRVNLRKVIDHPELDPVVNDILAVPATNEALLLKAVRDARGDESVEIAAAAAARAAEALRGAYGGELPADVRKAMADIAGVLDDEAAGAKDDARRIAQLSEDDERDEDDVLDEQQRISRARAESNEAAMAKGAEMESVSDAYDRVALDWAADRVQKTDKTLTRAQAIAKALEDDPGLADRARRSREAALEKAERERVEKRAHATRELEREAERIRKESGFNLTSAQAFVKALKEHRELRKELG